jgi:hypothetical protein
VLYASAMWVMAHMDILGRPLVFRTGDYYNWPGGETWQRFREYDPQVRNQVVIIGSSHAYRGYDPFVFIARGHSTFNLGTSAQTPLNTYYLIKEYLDSANCGLLVFDVYEGALTNSGLESTADLTQNQPSDAAALGMAWSLRDLRGLNMMALRELSDRSKPFYLGKNYVGKGFCRFKDSVRVGAGPPHPPRKPLSARQLDFLAKCIHLCQDRGIPVVVASHYARRNLRGPAHAPLAHAIDSVLAGTGVRYLDFADAPGVDDENWFADENHLNGTGARIFTGHLVDTLESLGYLHRP